MKRKCQELRDLLSPFQHEEFHRKGLINQKKNPKEQGRKCVPHAVPGNQITVNCLLDTAVLVDRRYRYKLRKDIWGQERIPQGNERLGEILHFSPVP